MVQKESINIISKNPNPKIAMAMNNQEKTTRKCCRKRSFTEFATPLKREYLKEIEIPRGPTMKDLIAAGGDLTTIMSSLCQLTEGRITPTKHTTHRHRGHVMEVNLLA
jgi:hypothetical protein